MNNLLMPNFENSKCLEEKDINSSSLEKNHKIIFNRYENDESQKRQDIYFIGKKRFICSENESNQNNTDKKEEKESFPNKTKNLYSLETENNYFNSENKNMESQKLLFPGVKDNQNMQKTNEIQNNKINNNELDSIEICNYDINMKEYNSNNNNKEKSQNNYDLNKKDISHNNFKQKKENSAHYSQYIKNNNNQKYNEIKQLPNSLSHSSRFINKKNFIKEICFICGFVKNDCILFENNFDFFKYLSSLIVVRKSRKEFSHNELNFLNNNYSITQKILFSKNDINIDNNIYKDKFWCIQCLINIISSENIIKSLKDIIYNPRVYLKDKETIKNNEIKNCNLNIIQKNNKLNLINPYTYTFNSQLHCNTFQSDYLGQNQQFNYTKSFTNDLVLEIKKETNYIDNKKIYNNNIKDLMGIPLPLQNIYLNLTKINLSLHEMFKILLNLKKYKNNNLEYINISKNGKDFNTINRNIISTLTMINENINYLEIINLIKKEFKKLFELGFNIVNSINNYLIDIENKLIEKKNNNNLLLEQISDIKLINKENCFNLIGTLNMFITVINFKI